MKPTPPIAIEDYLNDIDQWMRSEGIDRFEYKDMPLEIKSMGRGLFRRCCTRDYLRRIGTTKSCNRAIWERGLNCRPWKLNR